MIERISDCILACNSLYLIVNIAWIETLVNTSVCKFSSSSNLLIYMEKYVFYVVLVNPKPTYLYNITHSSQWM